MGRRASLPCCWCGMPNSGSRRSTAARIPLLSPPSTPFARAAWAIKRSWFPATTSPPCTITSRTCRQKDMRKFRKSPRPGHSPQSFIPTAASNPAEPVLHLRTKLPHGRKPEIFQQPVDALQRLIQIVIVPEFFRRRHLDTRLAWIDFPRMDIENHRTPLAVALPHQRACHRVGKQPEITAAAARNPPPEHLRAAHRQLQRTLRQLLYAQRKIGYAVIGMEPNREDRRVVRDAGIAHDLKRPPGLSRDGKRRRTKPLYPLRAASRQHFE